MVILELVLGISWKLVNVLWSGSPSSNFFNIAGIIDKVAKNFIVFENLSI